MGSQKLDITEKLSLPLSLSYMKRPLSSPGGSEGKESACNLGDLGSTPGLERSPGEGKGYLPQYSGLENSMDSIVHGVAKSRTFTFTSVRTG